MGCATARHVPVSNPTGRPGGSRRGSVARAAVILALALTCLAACAGLQYSGPPEENRWEQNSHGHPG